MLSFIFYILNFVISGVLNRCTLHSIGMFFAQKLTEKNRSSNGLYSSAAEYSTLLLPSMFLLSHTGTLLWVIYFLCMLYEALTFPTCSGTLSFSNLFPVVLSVLSWWLHSRHLVFWLMRRKSSWLNNWKSSSCLSSKSVHLPMQILLIMICTFWHF